MGTLQPVTIIAQKKTILNTAVGVATVITREGQKIGALAVNQSFRNRNFLSSAWNFLKGVGPLIGRGVSVIGGVLIPISTGEGASLNKEQQEALRKQFFERHTNDPSEASDQYLSEVEERLNSGTATSNDWKFRDEINRRKTARDNGGGDGGNEKPAKYTNPGHHDPNGGELNYNPDKTVLPQNHEDLWAQSKADPNNNKVRWAKEGKGKKAVYHRFSGDDNNDWHYSGSSYGKTKSGKIKTTPVSNDVKKLWKN